MKKIIVLLLMFCVVMILFIVFVDGNDYEGIGNL